MKSCWEVRFETHGFGQLVDSGNKLLFLFSEWMAFKRLKVHRSTLKRDRAGCRYVLDGPHGASRYRDLGSSSGGPTTAEGLSYGLDVESPARQARAPGRIGGDSRADPPHEPRESRLGRAAHS